MSCFRYPGLEIRDDEVVGNAGGGLVLLGAGGAGDAEAEAGLRGVGLGRQGRRPQRGDGRGQAEGAEVGLAPEAHRVALV